jgi:hypothetical protein
MKTSNRCRAGVATIWVMVVLSALTLLGATITAQYLTIRRVQRDHENKLQAEWLARSGVELAAERLLGDTKGYDGEKAELIPNSELKIEVKQAKPDLFEVTSTARYPTNSGPRVVERTQTRTFKRVVDGEKVRLEVVPIN